MCRTSSTTNTHSGQRQATQAEHHCQYNTLWDLHDAYSISHPRASFYHNTNIHTSHHSSSSGILVVRPNDGEVTIRFDPTKLRPCIPRLGHQPKKRRRPLHNICFSLQLRHLSSRSRHYLRKQVSPIAPNNIPQAARMAQPPRSYSWTRHPMALRQSRCPR
jgi:hypothetical protein